MATGLPVVAAELVAHGRNGFLAAPGRADEVAACLDVLVSDPGLRAAMGAESLRIVRGHERQRWLAEWASLYGVLAATGPGDQPR